MHSSILSVNICRFYPVQLVGQTRPDPGQSFTASAHTPVAILQYYVKFEFCNFKPSILDATSHPPPWVHWADVVIKCLCKVEGGRTWVYKAPGPAGEHSPTGLPRPSTATMRFAHVRLKHQMKEQQKIIVCVPSWRVPCPPSCSQ